MGKQLSQEEMKKRVSNITRLAESKWPYGEYRDMAHDELVRDPDQSDEEIAQDLAMRWAFP